MRHQDFPLVEVAAKAKQIAAMGHEVHQKFTCAGCGTRLTISAPNKFHTKGTCDQCKTVTDIAAQGCSFVVVMGRKT
jgi:hypothetical protein